MHYTDIHVHAMTITYMYISIASESSRAMHADDQYLLWLNGFGDAWQTYM